MEIMRRYSFRELLEVFIDDKERNKTLAPAGRNKIKTYHLQYNYSLPICKQIFL
jgi:hypothetical protein